MNTRIHSAKVAVVLSLGLAVLLMGISIFVRSRSTVAPLAVEVGVQEQEEDSAISEFPLQLGESLAPVSPAEEE